MSANGGNDRVTNRQLYEALWGLDQKLAEQMKGMPNRSWVLKTVGGALIVGQLASRYTGKLDPLVTRLGHMILSVLF